MTHHANEEDHKVTVEVQGAGSAPEHMDADQIA